ncbi:SGNH/GDSL hydrolase family protein [Salibacterium aidingense]|uniref:SGNH/GDSL hydrolase family protein n=1 Tax=Salibacterium aidingense TaxID=384933 RepID=UPI000423843C|nr:SGNH/GDSL hydrolase family protein [Salibacterium aidingense]
MSWKEKDRIILIGDSITEKGRFEDPDQLGDGYVRLIHDYLVTQHPTLRLDIVNKGIGGNRVTDLAERWEQDALQESPDWISISIGINDVWRQLDRPDMEQVYPDMFETVYEDIISQTIQHKKAHLILMEPTIIDEDPASKGNQLLQPYVATIHRLAEQYNALVIPTHQAFLTFLNANTDIPLTTDGVHMNSRGDMLMASTWLEQLYSS